MRIFCEVKWSFLFIDSCINSSVFTFLLKRDYTFDKCTIILGLRCQHKRSLHFKWSHIMMGRLKKRCQRQNQFYVIFTHPSFFQVEWLLNLFNFIIIMIYRPLISMYKSLNRFQHVIGLPSTCKDGDFRAMKWKLDALMASWMYKFPFMYPWSP